MFANVLLASFVLFACYLYFILPSLRFGISFTFLIMFAGFAASFFSFVSANRKRFTGFYNCSTSCSPITFSFLPHIFLSSYRSSSLSPSIFIALFLFTFVRLCTRFVNVLLTPTAVLTFFSTKTFGSVPYLPPSIFITPFPFTFFTLGT